MQNWLTPSLQAEDLRLLRLECLIGQDAPVTQPGVMAVAQVRIVLPGKALAGVRSERSCGRSCRSIRGPDRTRPSQAKVDPQCPVKFCDECRWKPP